MSETSVIVDALYKNFLLRDLFAKIVPGILVLSSIVVGSPAVSSYLATMTKIGWPSFLIGAGAAWIVGFSVQEIGELMRVIEHHPSTYDESKERYQLRHKFKECASEADLQQVERYAIIKEATGNGATSILIAILIGLSRSGIPGGPSITVEVLCVGLFLLMISGALLRANRSHAHKQYSYMESIVHGTAEKGE